ncbi:MAG: 5-formyltetrahydrofolate cyclo-ligase [Faecalibacterium sp.]
MTITEQKKLQRAAGISARKALAPDERAAANAALCARIAQEEAFQNANVLLAYAAFGGEADLSDLLAEAERMGKTVAYPICGADFLMTAAVPAAQDGWETGRYGIRTPILERARLLEPEELELILVPCTAFDAECRRVGMGKGYYDRYLPRCRRAVTIGAAFEAQRVEKAAVEETDRRPDFFITEGGKYTWN